MNPVINIKFGKLIDPYFRDWVKAKHPDYVFPDEATVKEKVNLFKSEWAKYDRQIVGALQEATGLMFKRNVIDVFIVSAVNRDMSAPLIIRSRYSPSEFVDVLTHELIHVLFGDNTLKLEREHENKAVQNHVYVNAILKYIYLDVLKEPTRLKNELKKSNEANIALYPVNADYAKAWQIVEEVGYMKLIQEIKESHA